MIYLDNAATSWPKPESVYRATDQALRRAANPGRGGHRFSRDSAHLVCRAGGWSSFLASEIRNN